MRESKVSQGLLIQNVERRICLIKTMLSISLTKINYPCLKLQQEACIRKLVLDCNDDVFAVLPSAGYCILLVAGASDLWFRLCAISDFRQPPDQSTGYKSWPVISIYTGRQLRLKLSRLTHAPAT